MEQRDYQGKVQNGRRRLLVNGVWVEVQEDVYTVCMDSVWREEKNENRRSRCIIGGRRCMKDCSACPFERTGTSLSLEQLAQESDWEAPDTRHSVEDQVIRKMEMEELHKALRELPGEDQILIRGLYFTRPPLTQVQIARELHISQQAVSKKHNAILAKLRSTLKGTVCDREH